MKMNELKKKMYNSLPVELIKNIMIYNAMKLFYKIIIRRTFNNFKYNKSFSIHKKLPSNPYVNNINNKCFICSVEFNSLTGINNDRSYVLELMNKYYSRYDRPICNKCNTICELRDNINKKNNNNIFREKLFVNKKYLIPENLFNSFSSYNFNRDYNMIKTRNLFNNLDANDEEEMYLLEIMNNKDILEELYEVLLEEYDGIIPVWITKKYYKDY